MEEQLISFETAKLAKEKGFNEKCIFHYLDSGELYAYDSGNRSARINNNSIIYTPTQSLLQKWIREVHNIDIWVERYLREGDYFCKSTSFYDNQNPHKTYEEALEAGLIEALKLIK